MMIVMAHPLGSEQSDFVEVLPEVLRQPLITDGAVESLDVGVLLRLAGLDVVQPDRVFVRPGQD